MAWQENMLIPLQQFFSLDAAQPCGLNYFLGMSLSGCSLEPKHLSSDAGTQKYLHDRAHTEMNLFPPVPHFFSALCVCVQNTQWQIPLPAMGKPPERQVSRVCNMTVPGLWEASVAFLSSLLSLDCTTAWMTGVSLWQALKYSKLD